MKILIISKNDDQLREVVKCVFQSFDRNMIVCSVDLADIREYDREPWDYVININGVCENVNSMVRNFIDFELNPLLSIDDMRLICYRFYTDQIIGGYTCPCGANNFCKCQ